MFLKIKMTTCAIKLIDGKMVTFENKATYETGINIDEKTATEFVNANFAISDKKEDEPVTEPVEEVTEEPVEKPVEEVKATQRKRKVKEK